MNGVVIAVLVGAALLALASLRRELRARRGTPEAVISESRSVTSLDDSTGAVRSVQAADVLLPPAALEQIWSAEYLERLARTYWRFLSRITLGLIQVRY